VTTEGGGWESNENMHEDEDKEEKILREMRRRVW